MSLFLSFLMNVKEIYFIVLVNLLFKDLVKITHSQKKLNINQLKKNNLNIFS